MEIASANKTRYRYPGTKFFEANQTDIFFGRKEETDSLVHSIKAHDIFVIFADSGIGKTSLLNAGLIPEFQHENDLEKIIPVKFRFQDTTITPLEIIGKKLKEYLDPGTLLITEKKYTLWQLLKYCHFKETAASKEKTPLFIFDQFEEFFNHRKSDREACITELSELTNQYLPDYIREEMTEKFGDRKPGAEETKYYTAPRVKMLFLIRADKLKLLDDLSKKIPLILRNRFHLKPLNKLQAEQAILFPASLPRNGFASPAFSFEDQAVEQICNYLKNDEEEVESFQLQVLCQELEKRVIERYAAGKNPDAVLITAKELGGEEGMNDITRNYYINKINAIEDVAMRKKAVELIEDKLIVEDRRISQSEFLLLNEGYSRELLDYLLEKTRLIRIDNDRYIEISHDRLLPSILNLKKKRKEEEEKESAIKQIKEEEEKRKQQLLQQQEEDIKKLQLEYLTDKVKKAAKLRIYIMLLIALLIGLFWTSIVANKATTRANIEWANNLFQQQKYDSAIIVANNKTFFGLFNVSFRDTLKKLERSILFYKAKHDSAMLFIQSADSVTNAAISLIAVADSLIGPSLSTVQKNTLVKLNYETVNFNIIDSVTRQLVLARQLYDAAINTGFAINDTTGGYLNRIFENIGDETAHVLKLTTNLTISLLQSGQKEKARLVYLKAQHLIAAANDNYITLDPDDTLHLNNLKNKII